MILLMVGDVSSPLLQVLGRISRNSTFYEYFTPQANSIFSHLHIHREALADKHLSWPQAVSCLLRGYQADMDWEKGEGDIFPILFLELPVLRLKLIVWRELTR